MFCGGRKTGEHRKYLSEQGRDSKPDHTGGRRELLHGAIPAPQNYWRNVIVSNKHEMNTRNIKKKEDRNFNVALNTQYRIVFKLSKKFQLKLISIP